MIDRAQLALMNITGDLYRVEHFENFEKLVSAITSKTLRILTEHIELKDSLDSKLQIFFIYFNIFLSILELIDKKRIF